MVSLHYSFDCKFWMNWLGKKYLGLNLLEKIAGMKVDVFAFGLYKPKSDAKFYNFCWKNSRGLMHLPSRARRSKNLENMFVLQSIISHLPEKILYFLSKGITSTFPVKFFIKVIARISWTVDDVAWPSFNHFCFMKSFTPKVKWKSTGEGSEHHQKKIC